MFNRVLMQLLIVFCFSSVYAAVPSGYLFYFDAKEVNGVGQQQPMDGALITQWVDLSSGIVASASSGSTPRFDENVINGRPGVKFGPIAGSSEGVFSIPNSNDINLDTEYSQKTFAMVFKTSSDVSTLQFLYEQGGRVNGYNMMIKNGDLWFGLWRRNASPENSSINLGSVSPDTIYQLVAVHDSSASEVRVYLDGNLETTKAITYPLIRHSGTVKLGGNDATVDVSLPGITGTISGADFFFKGHIGEFYSWNDSLTTAEIADITQHFNEQWEPVDIVVSQSVVVADDFFSISNDKAISGAIMEYTLLVTNQGVGIPAEDLTNISIDIDETKYRFYIGSDPAISPISIQDTVSTTGISFTYSGINATGDGFNVFDSFDTLIATPTIDDDTLTGISRIQLDFTGIMNPSSGGVSPQFEIKYKIKIL